jgi:hypothetical protein
MAATGKKTTAQANRLVQQAVDAAIRDGGEIHSAIQVMRCVECSA